MNTKIEEIDGKYIATLEGEMDTAAAVEVSFETTLSEQRQGRHHRLQEPRVYCFQWPAHFVEHTEGCQGQWQQGGAAWCER